MHGKPHRRPPSCERSGPARLVLQSEAAKYSIKAMPTFVFFQHSKEVARLQGASKDPIEQTIKKFYKETPTKDTGYVSDRADDRRLIVSVCWTLQTDLKPFIEERSCTALNEIDKWQNAVLGNQPGMFRSDEDDPEVGERTRPPLLLPTVHPEF